MIKKILISIITVVSLYLIYIFGMPIVEHYFFPKIILSMPAPPPPVIGVEAGPVKVIITEETPWSSIAKLLVTILGTILGIRLINKYIK